MRLKYDEETQTLTVPNVPGVTYTIDGEPVSGQVKLEKTTTVKAEPKGGIKFKKGADTEWTFEVAGDQPRSVTPDQSNPFPA